MDEMAEAHTRDYADKARLDELRAHIAAFVDEPPARASNLTLGVLTSAVRNLGKDADRVVGTWA